jgi:uncharacterized protein (TIGR03663 family)
MKHRAAFVILVCLAGGCAAAMLLPKLAVRPMHTDEAVHAWKLGDLLERNYYRYDPNEFHGPALNYLTLPIAHLRGQHTYASLDEVTLRLVPAICGIALVIAALLLLDGLGGWAVAAAALLTALSPAMSYFSRYYIMEAPLVLFTFLLIAAGYRYARGGHLGWCVLAGLAAGLMYATKETWVFAIAAMVVALGAAALWRRLAGNSGMGVPPMSPRGVSPLDLLASSSCTGETPMPLRQRLWNWRVLAALAAWAIVAGVFFSSFFTNARGPIDAVAAYAHAFGRAMGGPDEGGNLHLHPWYFHFQNLFYTNYPGRGPVWTEALIGVLAVVGIAAGFTGRGLGKADGRLVRFLAVYTVALLGIYTVLPYKTPWCALSPLHGMILLAGVGAGALVRLMPRIRLKAALCVLLLAGAGHLGWLAFLTNFRCYDDRRNPWVYAHTLSGAVKLGQRAEGIASIDPAGYHMRINVFTPDPHDQWPLPWYLRRFDRVAYFTDAPANPDAPMIIFRPEAWPRLQERLKDKDNYQYEHVGLRPAVVLTVGIRADLWKKYRDEVLAKRRPPASAQASAPASPAGRPVP